MGSNLGSCKAFVRQVFRHLGIARTRKFLGLSKIIKNYQGVSPERYVYIAKKHDEIGETV